MSSTSTPSDEKNDKSAASGPGSAASGSASVHRVTSAAAKGQYLVATRPAWGLNALSPAAMIDVVETALNDDPAIDVIKTLRARGIPGTPGTPTQHASSAAGGQGQAQSQAQQSQAQQSPYNHAARVLVARMSEEKAALLSATGFERGVIVERDQLLSLSHPGVPEANELALLDAAAIAPLGKPLNIDVLVVGANETPLEGAQVVLYGSGLPSEAITDQRGRARLTVSANSLETVRALYVKPAADHWDTYLQQPSFQSDKLNVIQLNALGTQLTAWGLKAMRLDSLPAEYTGRGAKIAIVDSGINTSHPALTRVNSGIDISNPTVADAWRSDPISHGTHLAGVIGGAQLPNLSIRGIAPEAELFGAKVFPGGHFSDLIDALDYAISQQVDIVNLSLGSDIGSEIVEQKLAEARARGVAVIVAAGNTGRQVQFPARSPHVLAVSAIGKLNEFPAESYHARTVLGDPRQLAEGGYFAAKFSSYGNEISLCGPGVAIISAISPNNFAVLDGTSLAASHISGLAALIVAHHPDFKDRYRARNAQRVERLFEILRQSARPIHVGDQRRVGAGLPDAVRALGLDVTGSQEARDRQTAGFQALREQLRGLGILHDGHGGHDGQGAAGQPAHGTQAGVTGATGATVTAGSGRASTSRPSSAPPRNGARAATGPNGQGASQDQSSSRIVTSLLLAELRKHLEDAQLIASEDNARAPRRAVGEAE